MPEFVSAYSDDDSNTLVSVTPAFAESAGLTVLKSEPATDASGQPLAAREGNRTSGSTPATTTASTSGGKSASKPEEAH